VYNITYKIKEVKIMAKIIVNENDGLFWKVNRLLNEIQDKFEIGFSKNIGERVLTIVCEDAEANEIKQFIFNGDTSVDEDNIVIEL
jgi:hypothetical protein